MGFRKILLLCFSVIAIVAVAVVVFVLPKGGKPSGIHFMADESVKATITGAISGNNKDVLLNRLEYGDGAVPTGEDLSSWQVELEFDEEDEITITINVNNNNNEPLYVFFRDNGKAINNVTKIITNNGFEYESGRVILLQSKDDKTEFVITFRKEQDISTSIKYLFEIKLQSDMTDEDIAGGSVETEETSGYTYAFDNTKYTASIKGVTAGNVETNIELPSMVVKDGQIYMVTSIKLNAFKNNKNIVRVVIPNTITEIGTSAFENCSNLTSIEISTSVTKFGGGVFKGCTSLTGIEFPNTTTNLGANILNGCTGITSLVIPESVIRATETTLNGITNLQSLTIPAYLTMLGDGIFNELSNLKSVIVNSTGEVGTAFEDNTHIETIEIREGITEVCACAFYGCSALTNIIIPSSVASIGNYAFSGCASLTRISLPYGVVTIGEKVFFNNSNLTNISLPSSIEKIGKEAFDGCNNLVYSTYNNTKYLGNSNNLYLVLVSANNTEIQECSIYEGCRIIYHNAFANCSSLTQISVPNTVKYIGERAFEECSSMSEISLSQNLVEIGQYAFNYCSSLTEITIPNSLRTIQYQAFLRCDSLEKVTIHDLESWLKISFDSDYSNPLLYAKHLYLGNEEITRVVIPNTITKINPYAFHYATNIISVVIPESVTEIGDEAFRVCEYLVEVYNLSSIALVKGDYRNGAVAQHAKAIHTNINDSTIIKNIGGILYYTENGKYVAFKLENKQLTNITLDENCIGVEMVAFRDCTSIQTVNIHNNIKEIGEKAFYGCSSLSNVLFDEDCTITKIDFGAFAYTNIQNFNVPDSVTSVGLEAFDHCSNLESVYIGSGLTSFLSRGTGNCSPFSYCENLTSITVSEQNAVFDSRENCNAIIKKSNKRLYYGCKTSTIPDSVREVGIAAFYGCTGLTSIVIGSGVVTIGAYAFEYCTDLVNVYIPDGVAEIDEMAFGYCSSLRHIYIPSSVTTMDFLFVGSNPFFGCSAGLVIYTGVSTIPQYWGSGLFLWDRQVGWRMVDGYDRTHYTSAIWKGGYTREAYLEEIS